MKTKTKKGKAIIGIAMAAIMLASVMVAMAPTSARDAAGRIEQGDVVYMGEKGLDVRIALASTTTGAFHGIADSTADGEIITVSDATDFDVPTTVEEGPYNKTGREGKTADIIVKEPEITVDILDSEDNSIAGKSIPVGTVITIRAKPNFGSILKDADTGANGQIKIKFTDPSGLPITRNVAADDTEIDTDYDTSLKIDEVPQITASDWEDGTWKVKIATDKDTCNELDISSSEVEFTIRSEELTIDAEDEVGMGEDIIIKVEGKLNTVYYFAIENVKDGEEPEIQTTSDDVEAVGRGEGEAGSNTAAWIQTGSDGLAEFGIDTTDADDRTYTMNVYYRPKDADGLLTELTEFVKPANIVDSERDADYKVKVAKATVDLTDTPDSAIIGEEVTIKGTVSAGEKVDIVIEDANVVFNEVDVDADEFEEDWDTKGLTKGSYTIDVYIDTVVGLGADGILGPEDYEAIDEDGSTSIRLVSGELTAEQLRNVVAEDDEYGIEGTATGVDAVDIILIGPNGFPPGSTAADLHVKNGLEMLSASVTDDAFNEEIDMGGAGFDTGRWMALVLSPGRDAAYSTVDDAEAGGLEFGSFPALGGKNQDQIMSIIKAETIDVAGSDDLLEELTFRVESAYVKLDPVVSVPAGEPLNISGTTNREPDTRITVSTFAGPMDLPTGFADVTWPTASEGVFTAEIVTTDAVPGTYTLEADDGDGNTDTGDVQILSAVPVTETPVVEVTPTEEEEATPTPEALATPTPTVEEEPTPTPTEPGFEMVFAIAGLLAVAYLVLRKRR